MLGREAGPPGGQIWALVQALGLSPDSATRGRGLANLSTSPVQVLHAGKGLRVPMGGESAQRGCRRGSGLRPGCASFHRHPWHRLAFQKVFLFVLFLL